MRRERILILGAAGRDFHNFNLVWRDDPSVEVVGFTAAQIPGIDGRRYPAELAGTHYPQGIPIFDEGDFEAIVRDLGVQRVVMAYSDTAHETVMHLASRALAAGADFSLCGPRTTMIASSLPVVAVTAVRTGCGKSQTSRYVADFLREAGLRAVAVRHPMPYGNLVEQKVQRFGSYEDLAAHKCTIEEREEYESHIDNGTVVYAGVDYGAILVQAEREADVVIWDGGNNDLPFFRPDLWIVVADPLRPGHELKFHPGETNFRAADVVVVNKVTDAKKADVDAVVANAKALNPEATVVLAASKLTLDKPEQVKGRRVLLVDDGPTITHGGMPFGAGKVAAEKHGAGATVDARPYAVGSIRGTFEKYPHIGQTLPAMGYSDTQIRELAETIRATPCDVVVSATPIDLGKLLKVDKPVVRVRYELQDLEKPTLREVLQGFAARVLRA